MLNTYFSLLPIYLPYIARIQHRLIGSLRGWATALSFYISQLHWPSFTTSWSFYFGKQLQKEHLWFKFLRIPFVVFVISFFLFVGPEASVLADWEEKVIPTNHTADTQKLTYQINALEIPKFKKAVNNSYISTYFSRFHQGIDLPSMAGSPVRPVANGTVVYAGWSNLGYGNLVIVRHELGYESLYAHLSRIAVEDGESVDYETILGGVGSTGVSSGNHLHLEIHQHGVPVNPLSLFKN